MFLKFWVVDSVDEMQREKNSAVKPLLVILAILAGILITKPIWEKFF